MKFILSALALVLLVSVVSAGYLHGGWSAPVYRRVVYSSPSYRSGWSNGWSGYRSYGGWNNGWGSGWW